MVRIIDGITVDTSRCNEIWKEETLESTNFIMCTPFGRFILMKIPLQANLGGRIDEKFVSVDFITEAAVKEILAKNDGLKYIEVFGQNGLTEA